MEKGKGWHLEHTRHSEARLYGKASGGKVSAPKDPLKSAGNKKRFGVVRGRNVYLMDKVKTSPKKVAVQDLNTGDTAVISKQEVKKISNKFPTEKSIKESTITELNENLKTKNIIKIAEQEHKANQVYGTDNTSTSDLIKGTKVKAKSKTELRNDLKNSFPNYDLNINETSNNNIYNVKITRQKPKQNIEFSKPYKQISREQYFKNQESGKREYDKFQVAKRTKLKSGLYDTKLYTFNSLKEANVFLKNKPVEN